MGFFSSLFSPKKEEETDPQAKALRHYFDENLPKHYVNSKKYAVSITKKVDGYTAKITLDMRADGSDYSTFRSEDYIGLSNMESGYLLGTLTGAPVSAEILFEMVFDPKHHITVDAGRMPVG